MVERGCSSKFPGQPPGKKGSSTGAETRGLAGVLVRASGTESLVRVMVEANDLKLTQKIADSLAQLVRSELKQ